jgi:hypothetical protein
MAMVSYAEIFAEYLHGSFTHRSNPLEQVSAKH